MLREAAPGHIWALALWRDDQQVSQVAELPAHTASTQKTYDRRSAVALAVKLRGLRMRNLLKYTDLLVDAGVVPLTKEKELLAPVQQRLSRWVRNPDKKWNLLTQEEFDKISAHVQNSPQYANSDAENTYAAAILPDAVFYSLEKWLGMNDETRTQLYNEFAGYYMAYRPSLTNKERIFRGRMIIDRDAQTNALITREKYHYPTEEDRRLKEHTSDLAGYFFKRKDQYLILSRDIDTGDLQYIYVNNVVWYQGKAAQILGVVYDIQGATPYATRIGFQLRSNDPNDAKTDNETLNAIPLADCEDQFIRSMLGVSPVLEHGICLFT